MSRWTYLAKIFQSGFRKFWCSEVLLNSFKRDLTWTSTKNGSRLLIRSSRLLTSRQPPWWGSIRYLEFQLRTLYKGLKSDNNSTQGAYENNQQGARDKNPFWLYQQTENLKLTWWHEWMQHVTLPINHGTLIECTRHFDWSWFSNDKNSSLVAM